MRQECTQSSQMYIANYPDRTHPVEGTFWHIVKTVRQTGSFIAKKKERECTIRNEANVIAYWLTLQLSHRFRFEKWNLKWILSRFSIQRILAVHKMHPHKCFLTHELNEQDYVRRMEFLAGHGRLIGCRSKFFETHFVVGWKPLLQYRCSQPQIAM